MGIMGNKIEILEKNRILIKAKDLDIGTWGCFIKEPEYDKEYPKYLKDPDNNLKHWELNLTNEVFCKVDHDTYFFISQGKCFDGSGLLLLSNNIEYDYTIYKNISNCIVKVLGDCNFKFETNNHGIITI